jgi:tryptophan-rich sensory protein
MTRQIAGLLVALVACYGAAALGGILTSSSVSTWYQTLQKPSFNPPSWVFGPVWTILYGMMAVAAWLVWRGAATGEAKLPLVLFAVQLCLNVAWSALFFGLRQPGWAFVEICLPWVATGATLVVFWRLSLIAGWLMAPYLLWVSFAAILNLNLWLLNR